MKQTMKSVPFLEKKFLLPLKEVCLRFPLAIILFAINAIFLSVQILQSNSDDSFVLRITLPLVITGILSVAVSLFVEKSHKKNWNILHVLPIIYGIVLHFSYKNTAEFLTPIFLQTIAIILSVFVISSKKSEHDEHFWNICIRIITALLLAGIVGATSGILGMIAIASITELFNLDYDASKWIGIWWVISLGFFAPTFALAQFPRTNEVSREKFEVHKIWDFFTKFLFIPFTILYFIILYAYSIKVLLHFHEWPNGIIASMVMGFSILGYLSYVLSRNSENTLIQKFRTFLPFAVLPQLLMLFYAIYLRINQYGLTINRYSIVLVGIILTILSLHFIISKKKKLITIPLVFSIFALIFSVGPWWVYALPLQKQIESLEHMLANKKYFDANGYITRSDQKFSIEEARIVQSKISLICAANNCDYFRNKIPNFSENMKKFRENYRHSMVEEYGSWEIEQMVQEKLGIQDTIYTPSFLGQPEIYLSVPNNMNTTPRPSIYMSFDRSIDITGYQVLYGVYGTCDGIPSSSVACIDTHAWQLRISIDGKDQIFDLNTFTNSLSGKYNQSSVTVSDTKELETTIENTEYTGRVLFSTYVIPNPEYHGGEEVHGYWINGILLLRKK